MDVEFIVENYHEQSVGKGADAKALAIVPLKTIKGKKIYGVGIDSNIDQAAVRAIVCCLNRLDFGEIINDQFKNKTFCCCGTSN